MIVDESSRVRINFLTTPFPRTSFDEKKNTMENLLRSRFYLRRDTSYLVLIFSPLPRILFHSINFSAYRMSLNFLKINHLKKNFKKYFFAAVKSYNRIEKYKPPKYTARTSTKSVYRIWKRDMNEIAFFLKVKKGQKSSLSPFPIDLGG